MSILHVPHAHRKPGLTWLSAAAPVLCTIVAPACGGASGTHPHDMSAAHHEQAAAREAEVAGAHERQYDPDAAQATVACDLAVGQGFCWEEWTNPTAEHREEAERHRETAAQHRAASKALVDAEAAACGGIAPADRDASPFTHRGDIRSVSPLTEGRATGKSATSVTSGATIVFRAIPGLTAEWLQRIVDCHLARNSALGHDMPEMPDCPLVPRGAEARVRSVGDGFAVDVRADDGAAASEIWRRAQRLVSHAGATK